MAYTIIKSDGTVLTTIADGTLNTNSTSLGLPGRDYSGYGRYLDSNFVWMLENFANNSPPSNPIRGQLWYNTNDNNLYVCPSDGITDPASWVQLQSGQGNTSSTFDNITATGNVVTGNLVAINSVEAQSNIKSTNGYFVSDNGALGYWLKSSGNNVGKFYYNQGAVKVEAIDTTSNVQFAANGTVRLSIFANGLTSVNGPFSVSGNANIGNIGTAGLITAEGVVRGGALSTGGSLGVTGNANIGNIGTAGIIAATGNIITNGRMRAIGLSTSWGITTGNSVGALNSIMGSTNGATWLVSGTANGEFRAGIQAYDPGNEIRIYTGANHFRFVNDVLQANSFNSNSSITATGNITGGNILTGGNVLVGTTSLLSNILGVSSAVQIRGATANTSSMLLGRTSADTNPPTLWFAKDRANGTVSADDDVGLIRFTGNDGTSYIETARILSEVDGTPSANNVPGRIVFFTNSANSTSTTERMRINSSGNVGIANTTPTHTLSIGGTLNVTGNVTINSSSINGNANSTAKVVGAAFQTISGANSFPYDNGMSPVTYADLFTLSTTSVPFSSWIFSFNGQGSNTTELLRFTGSYIVNTSGNVVTITNLTPTSNLLFATTATSTSVTFIGAHENNALMSNRFVYWSAQRLL